MQTWHIHEDLNAFVKLKGDLIHLFLSGVFRKVAIILLYLFGPIFVFQSARTFGFEFRLAVVVTLLFYIVDGLFKLLTLFLAEDLSQRWGFKTMILISAVPFLLFMPVIILATNYPLLFPIGAALLGIHAGFYWWGYHGYFVKTGDKDHFGLSVGEAGFLETLASVLTPALGAVITTFLGFPALFISAGIFMIIALFFLGKDHDKRQKHDIKINEVLSLISKHKSVSLAYFGSNGEAILYSVAWPIFLFIFFGQLLSLGAVVSLATLVAAVFALAVGEWVDKKGERDVIRVGSPLIFLSWIIRAVNKSFGSFIFADSFWKFGQRMVVLPLNALTYIKAIKGKSSSRAILFREISLLAGSTFSLGVLAILVYSFGNLEPMFYLAAFLSLLPLVAVFKKKLPKK